jgi:Protein of unknown function (DUF3014)
MDERNMWIGAIVVLVLIAGAFFLLRTPPEPASVSPAPVAVQPPAQPEPEPAQPEIQYPVPAPAPAEVRPAATPEPLPALEESDAPLLDALHNLFGQESLSAFLIPEQIIQRIVVTVDNLPREKLALRQRPVPAIPGAFAASGPDENLILNPDNYARYAPFVNLVRGLDAGRAAAVYFRFYPLFQQAYVDLGYPNAYFNDRLVQVIDHLLVTPDVPDPIRLVRPSVYFKFADPELEKRSTGQKTLIRMGCANAAVIKQKLRELRAAVAGRTPK